MKLYNLESIIYNLYLLLFICKIFVWKIIQSTRIFFVFQTPFLEFIEIYGK
jgi:hypothetical protein